LNVLNILDWTHLYDGQDLVRVCFDAVLSDDVPQELPPGDFEGAFFWVQLNVESLEVVEGFIQVGEEVEALWRIYHNVVDINLKVAPYFLFEAKLHTLLICSPHVLQSDRHFYIAKITERSDERGGRLVCLGVGYLVITRVGMQETQELTPCNEVYNLVNARKGKWIFRTCLVQARVVNAHPPFSILLWYKNRICYLVRVLDFFNEAKIRSLTNSSPMALHFS
jgi:hypothetical protein